jgi:hypothetical protein
MVSFLLLEPSWSLSGALYFGEVWHELEPPFIRDNLTNYHIANYYWQSFSGFPVFNAPNKLPMHLNGVKLDVLAIFGKA